MGKNIRDIIQELLKDNEEIYSLVCEVTEVNREKRVCRVQPVNGDAEIFNVRLQSKVSSEIGLVLFPKLNSQVTVTFLSKELAFISLTNEIEDIKLDIGEFSLFIDKENFDKSVKNITINTENYEKNATDTKINTDNYELTGENAKFELSTIFEIISASDIKLKAVSYLLEAANVDIKGITNITGATTITGVTTINGAATISGAVSMGGGANGGIPKGSEIAFQLNALINELNKIIQGIRDWNPVANDGGAALKSSIGAINTFNEVSISQLTNSNATH